MDSQDWSSFTEAAKPKLEKMNRSFKRFVKIAEENSVRAANWISEEIKEARTQGG